MDCPHVDFIMSRCASTGLPSVCVSDGRRGSTLCVRVRSLYVLEKVHCMSLRSIHIYYNHDPVQAQVCDTARVHAISAFGQKNLMKRSRATRLSRPPDTAR